MEAAVADGTLEIEAGEVEDEGEELGEDPLALEDEPDLEGGSEGPVGPEGPGGLEDDALAEVTVIDDDAIVNEVMRRVAKRLHSFKR